jgi:hypothetical protein
LISKNQPYRRLWSEGWKGKRLADSIRHIPDMLYYKKDMIQLIPISTISCYQIDKYNHLLDQNREVIYGCVYEIFITGHMQII